MLTGGGVQVAEKAEKAEKVLAAMKSTGARYKESMSAIKAKLADANAALGELQTEGSYLKDRLRVRPRALSPTTSPCCLVNVLNSISRRSPCTRPCPNNCSRNVRRRTALSSENLTAELR